MVKIALLGIKRFASAPDTGLPTDAAQPHENAPSPLRERDVRHALEAMRVEEFSRASAKLLIKASDINNGRYREIDGDWFLESDLSFQTAYDLYEDYKLREMMAALEAEAVFSRFAEATL